MFYIGKNNLYSHYIVNMALFIMNSGKIYMQITIYWDPWDGRRWGDSCFWCCEILFCLYLSVGIGKLWNRLSLWKRGAYQNIGWDLRLRIGQNSMTWNKITGWQSCRRPFGLEKQAARQSDSIPDGIYCSWKSNDRSSYVGRLLEISRNLEFCKSLYLGLNIYPILEWYGRLFRQVGRGGYS